MGNLDPFTPEERIKEGAHWTRKQAEQEVEALLDITGPGPGDPDGAYASCGSKG